MVNGDIQMLQDPDGGPVANVAFDLSHEQLDAASYALGEMILERHRGTDLEIDDVLALRELTGVRDELSRMADAQGNAHVLMTLARFSAYHDAADEWVTTRTGRGWLREADDDALPYVGAMLGTMASLRERAVAAALGSAAASN
jgi:hypothetical protein